MLNLINAISVDEINKIVEPIIEICEVLVPVLLSVVGALGALYCILLGIKYAKADDPQEHEKAKNGLKHAIIGFVLIFVLLIMLKVGINVFSEWLASHEGF
jgi:hypothetical protein